MKKIYFISDAHLGSRGDNKTREREHRLVAWLNRIMPDCQALYMMGDMIDFWYEYKTVVPKGYVRFFGKIAEMTDAGIPVYWFVGNHDIWLYRYVQEELGVNVITQAVETTICGKRFYMAHGDRTGYQSFAYRVLMAVFHNSFCQRLFNALHPDLGIGFGLRWSEHSFEKRKRNPLPYLGEDKEYLVVFAKEDIKKRGEKACDYYVFGHRHIVLDMMISAKNRVLILGDWMQEFSYGVFDGKDFYIEYDATDAVLSQEDAE